MQTEIKWDEDVEPNWKGNYVYKDDRFLITFSMNKNGHWIYFISERPLFKAFHKRLDTPHTKFEEAKAEVMEFMESITEYDLCMANSRK